MKETWLRPNRRALWFGTVPPLIVAVLGVWLAFGPQQLAAGWTYWLGALLIVAGLALVVTIVNQLRRPRLAYQQGQVLFYVRSGQPIAVPVRLVEGFLLSRGPAGLPVAGWRQKSVNLVARLAQRETDWAERDVNRSLARWQDGYVTLRGTWCEPLSEPLIRQLNQRLHEVTCQYAGG